MYCHLELAANLALPLVEAWVLGSVRYFQRSPAQYQWLLGQSREERMRSVIDSAKKVKNDSRQYILL
jgi:hypothetical protein